MILLLYNTNINFKYNTFNCNFLIITCNRLSIKLYILTYNKFLHKFLIRKLEKI